MTRIALIALVAAVLSALVLPAAAEVTHPRLFITPEKVAAIKAAIKKPGSHHAEAYGALKARVDTRSYDVYSSEKYARSYAAREAAMMAVLAATPAEANAYADRAFQIIQEVYTDKSQPCDATRGSGLARGMMSLGLGIPYDWCCPLWSAEQRAFVLDKAKDALDKWPKFGHANLGDVRGSNWVAVTRGGELVLLLAAGEEQARSDRYTYLKRQLELHMRNGFGDLGVSQEGVGYTEYPGGFLLPAVYACASIGDDELMKVAETRAWWKLAMYAHSFQEHSRKFVMTGVAHTSNFDEGWASLLLNHAPKDQLPYFVWWYDRHMGRLGPGTPAERYDHHRAGTNWALIYYPTDVQDKDPTGTFPVGVADKRGYTFYRNRWKDADDVLASFMADAHHHGHAWDQPEVFALNALAMNSRFVGGPGKNRDQELYSSLLVDGQYNYKKATSDTGKLIHFETDTERGYAIAGGGALYKELGLDDAQRHFLARMSPNAAILSTLDRLKASGNHTYTWQANVGNEEGDDDVKVSAGTEAGRPMFLMQGRDGYLKGWVLHPADAKVQAGDPLRVETQGSDADIWVVMLVGPGAKAPAAEISGTGLGSKLKVGPMEVTYDAATDRITSK